MRGAGYGLGNVAAQGLVWFVCLIFTRVCSRVQRLAAKNMDSPHCLEASNFEITLK